MRRFGSKQEIFNYLVRKFKNKNTKSIIIRGSAATKKLRDFSDVDVEVYTNDLRHPYYEITCLRNNLVLLSVYFYKPLRKVKKSKGKLLCGDYYKPVQYKERYTKEERRIRDNQMLIDMLFKYARTRDKTYLKSIEKYLRI